MRARWLLVLAVAGCVRWQSVPLRAVRDDAVDLRTRTVRVATASDEAVLVVHRVSGTRVDGWDAAQGRERRVDLARATEVQMRVTDPLGTGLVVGGVYLVLTVISYLAVVVDAF